MRIAIVGQGAISSLFAYYWRDYSPTLLVRSAVSKQPKKLVLLNGEEYTLSSPLLDIDSNAPKAFDLILIAVKHYHMAALLPSLSKWVRPNTTLVLIQNGMGGARQIIQTFPNITLWLGTTTDAVFKKSEEVFQVTAQGQLHIGVYKTNKAINANSDETTQNVITSHPNASVLSNIDIALYKKLAINAVINPLTALLNIRNGELRNHTEQVKRAKSEVFMIYEAAAIGIPTEELNAAIDDVISLTANNYSSMQQDVYYKRETEIEGVLGYLLHKSRSVNVRCPYLSALYSDIKMLQKS